MAILNILHYPDQRLHTVATPVREVNAEIRKLVADMAETMYAAPGIGLAATQVNVHKQVIVIDISENHDQLMAFINPEIIASDGEAEREEGCLSVPGIYEKVSRAERVTVKALDLDGKLFTLKPRACWRYASSMKLIICRARYLWNTCPGSSRPGSRSKMQKLQRETM